MVTSGEYIIQEETYRHIILEGSAYQVGHSQGEIHLGNPKFTPFWSAQSVEPTMYGYHSLQDLQSALERWVPGLNEEIQGFADACGVPVAKAFHYMACASTVGGCSHVAVHPSITQDKQPLVARSYELNPKEEDLCLVTTRIHGKARHVGFATILLGRLDGINEYGLTIAMSASTTPPQREQRQGFDFWVPMRAVLDGCKTVAEAVELFRGMPLTCYTNFIVADSTGDAALIEIAGSQKAIQRIAQAEEPYLIANNHYALPEMSRHNLECDLGFSTCRREAIRGCLEASRPQVKEADLRAILSKEYPNGCFCPYYIHNLGTLWSMVFHPADKTVNLTFGAPTHNEWRTFGLDGEAGVYEYVALLPSRKT